MGAAAGETGRNLKNCYSRPGRCLPCRGPLHPTVLRAQNGRLPASVEDAPGAPCRCCLTTEDETTIPISNFQIPIEQRASGTRERQVCLWQQLEMGNWNLEIAAVPGSLVPGSASALFQPSPRPQNTRSARRKSITPASNAPYVQKNRYESVPIGTNWYVLAHTGTHWYGLVRFGTYRHGLERWKG